MFLYYLYFLPRMVYLRIKVPCFRCKRQVEKTKVLTVGSMTDEPRYECYVCFKRFANSGDRPKSRFLCQRCNYKFNSKKDECPYCNKSDLVIKGKITVHDLL